MSWWESLEGFDDWSAKLQELLSEAGEALKARDDVRQRAAQGSLNDFIRRSPNKFSKRMDEIALGMILTITTKAWEDAAAEIAQHNANLVDLIKEVEAITADNVDAVKTLRLEKARRVVDELTTTINSVKELKEKLGAGTIDQEVADKIEKTIKSIQTLRAAVEGLPPDGDA